MNRCSFQLKICHKWISSIHQICLNCWSLRSTINSAILIESSITNWTYVYVHTLNAEMWKSVNIIRECILYLSLHTYHMLILSLYTYILYVSLFVQWAYICLCQSSTYSSCGRSSSIRVWSIIFTFSIIEMLGIKSNLEILLIWRYHDMQQHILNRLFAIEPSNRRMAYRVTFAAHHHSVLSRINYDSCIYL